MNYRIFEHDRVKRFLKKHDNNYDLLLRIHKKYMEILTNPYANDFKELKSNKCPKCRRARVGKYRIIFYVNGKQSK